VDYGTYLRAYLTDPAPEPRFEFDSIRGVTLYYADFGAALTYYTSVLGESGYVEGSGTRGWRIGDSWMTLLEGGDGAPANVEVQIVMASPAEAERLQEAFIAAGGKGPSPTDELMYEPVRSCPVTDPFGTELLIYAPTG
jgi:hypothetical protein